MAKEPQGRTTPSIVETLAISKKLEGIPDGLPPEEVERLQKLLSRLTDFVLHLIQALLRSGYYTPDHPESIRAKQGLYQQFQALFEKEEELTFLVREEQERKEVWIESFFPEAQKLSRMMIKGMGEIYVPKFAAYLERKDLISLTLKSRMGQEEFTHFIDVMSDPALVDTQHKQDKERLAKALYSRGVISISLVFSEELLAPDREIPWRARVTLSRMRKDLRMIPLFQKMVKEEIKEIRKQLLWDSLRPLRQSDLLCATLQNSDVAAVSEQNEEAIEDDIVAYLQKQYLVGTCKAFLREHLALKQLKKQDAFEAKSDRLVKKLSGKLRGTETKEAENLLEEYFRSHLIGLEELTPALKDKILMERLTDKFLGYTDQFFEQLDQAKEREKFLTVATAFVKMIPELIRRDRYAEVYRILETMKTHFHQKTMWALLAGQIVEEIGAGPIPVQLAEKFMAGKKEIRMAILPIFVSLEIGAIPHLIGILQTSGDQWVRKNACEALVQIGPVAAAHLLTELNHQKISVETTCDILRVLGEIRPQDWKAPLIEILRKYKSHENPKLREQTLHTLCQIGGKEDEQVFLTSLKDPEVDVRKRAAWCLGMIKSQAGAERMVEILSSAEPHFPTDLDSFETQIYHALGIMGNLTVEGRTLEQILLQILEKRGMKQWLGLVKPKHLLSDAALGTLCEALGKIGTEESVPLLKRLEKSREGSWTPKIKEALRRIEARKK